ncbi:MAG: phenylacetate--CoA ligase family protein, partial [Stellaceae bacterium]
GCTDPVMTHAPREGFPAAPRSGVETVLWPALLPELQAKLLAIEFQLEQSEWWTEAELRQHQFEQLGNLLAHAQATVPFYAAGLGAAGYHAEAPLTPEIWGRIPILDRATVQGSRDALTSRAIPPSHGQVTELRIDRRSDSLHLRITEVAQLMRLAFFLREQIWHRRDLAAKRAVIQRDEAAAYPEGRREGSWGWPMGVLYETGPQYVLDRRAGLVEQVDWLRREEPTYLVVSPEGALALAREFQTQNLELPSLEGVQTLGGGLAPELRDACHAAWGVPVAHLYRAEEVGPLALQCPEHEHFHVQCEQALVEVVDDQGKPCAAGEVGRVVATPLNNFAMPLLRYEVGDVAEVGPPCACGRGLPVLTRILSRDRST